MTKHTLLSLLLMTFISCGKSGSSSSGGSGSRYNDSDLLPVDGEEYIPRGLSTKVIKSNGTEHSPMDFLSQELTMTFDPVAQTAKGHSVIKFRMRNAGRPYFELQSTVKNLKLDSQSVEVTLIKDPDGQGQSYRSVSQTVSPGDVHEIEFDYELPSDRVTFTGGGVRFLTDMTDLNGKFFEYWGPTGFEEDSFAMTMKLKVINGTSEHVLRSNGDETAHDKSSWTIKFPSYYSKSSFYVHLTNQTSLPSKKFVYQGIEKDIPVEIYGVTTALVNSAYADLPGLFKELEGDYGPYPHAKFVAYLNDRGGGMEYVGATITSVASLDHELLHSWFARSVIPADGRSGWIDEAIASWRDYGYKRSSTTLTRSPTNLADYSVFKDSTPGNSYVDGRALFAELDKEFASSGGLKKVMRAFHKAYRNKVVTNEEFWHFLEEHTGKNLKEFNDRYAMGGSSSEMSHSLKVRPLEVSKHPNPLTKEEILRLR